jgi:hypothetical protein
MSRWGGSWTFPSTISLAELAAIEQRILLGPHACPKIPIGIREEAYLGSESAADLLFSQVRIAQGEDHQLVFQFGLDLLQLLDLVGIVAQVLRRGIGGGSGQVEQEVLALELAQAGFGRGLQIRDLVAQIIADEFSLQGLSDLAQIGLRGLDPALMVIDDEALSPLPEGDDIGMGSSRGAADGGEGFLLQIGQHRIGGLKILLEIVDLLKGALHRNPHHPHLLG